MASDFRQALAGRYTLTSVYCSSPHHFDEQWCEIKKTHTHRKEKANEAPKANAPSTSDNASHIYHSYYHHFNLDSYYHPDGVTPIKEEISHGKGKTYKCTKQK